MWNLPRLSWGRTRGGQNVQKCAKMANFWTSGSIIGKRLKIDGYMGLHAARRLTSIEFSFDPWHCKIYRDCPRGVPRGSQNMLAPKWLHPQRHTGVAWLSWGSQIMCLRLIAETLTHVPLAIAILLITVTTEVAIHIFSVEIVSFSCVTCNAGWS